MIRNQEMRLESGDEISKILRGLMIEGFRVRAQGWRISIQLLGNKKGEE